jgi:hypothetical protein
MSTSALNKPEIESVPSSKLSPDFTPYRFRTNAFDQCQVIGFIGSAILFVGVFAPILKAPIIGSITYFRGGSGDGVIILILSLCAFFFTLIRRYRFLFYTGLASLILLIFSFIYFLTKMSDLKEDMNKELMDNPFKGVADAFIGAVEIQWGWPFLVIGAVLLIFSALMMRNVDLHQKQRSG